LAARPEFSIRAFSPEDAPALCKLHTRAILATPDAVYSKEQRVSWAHGLTPQAYLDAADKDETYEVAVKVGKVIGFCGRTAETVRGLYIDPDWQRHGIGRELLARAEAILRAEGRTVIDIEASLSAVGFYASAGYIKTSEEMRPSRGGLMMGSCMMRKALF
jgi:ribosomal protein S18 acetylase RimI-like enzyme